MIWVAVVGDFTAHLGWSKRSYGDWASFIGTDRTEVIQRAMGAKKAWKSAGPYKVYLGTITEEESVQGWKVVEPIPEPPPPPKRVPETELHKLGVDDDIPF